ncbi:ComF family protein [Cellulosimicrobium terreum]|nr:ComF family protein [Cellulosimicrobium terreum]
MDPDRCSVARRAAQDLVRLAVPVECPGCGTPDVRWCRDCLTPLAGPARRVEDGAPRLDRLDGVPPLPTWALASYSGPLRDVVVAWKDRGRADLDRPLSDAVRSAGAALAPLLRAVAGQGPVAAGGLLVVAAPTSRAARRARGREPVAVLADAFAVGLRSAGCAARVVSLLVQERRSRDQVGLGSRGRGARLTVVRLARTAAARALVGTPVRSVPACVLIDDVLTTGATIAACESALSGRAIPVLGAFTLVATPSPRGDRTTPGRSSGEGVGSPSVGAADTPYRGLR